MTSISPLANVIKKGLFGDYEGKNENDLIKIREIESLSIFQIVQYKNSSLQIKDISIDDLSLTNETLKTNCNNETRILWCGPKNWILISKKKDLSDNMKKIFNENDFAITDLSHSRAVIELEGKNTKEILKKGCPYNFNELKKNMCINSIFNGITITIDMLEENPEKIRLLSLRSFGESLYHSVTDASLEFGYKVL
jgi:sarcosine oxidase subunit gamma|tara:strand:- start:240 stop:827 length:588 start_codon:yes stop_codon:yes gene_type:complete